MPNYQIVCAPLPCEVINRGERPWRPAANVVDYLHPRWLWEADPLLPTQEVVLDFGAQVPLAGVFLDRMEGITTLNVTVRVDALPGPFISVFRAAPPVDALVGRPKVLVPINQTVRYVRLTQAPGAMVGVVYPFQATDVVTLLENPEWPEEFTLRRAQREIDYLTHGGEVDERGPIQVELTLGSEQWIDPGTPAQLADLRARVGNTQPIVVYENQGDTARAYLCRLYNDREVATGYLQTSETLTFREIV